MNVQIVVQDTLRCILLGEHISLGIWRKINEFFEMGSTMANTALQKTPTTMVILYKTTFFFLTELRGRRLWRLLHQVCSPRLVFWRQLHKDFSDKIAVWTPSSHHAYPRFTTLTMETFNFFLFLTELQDHVGEAKIWLLSITSSQLLGWRYHWDAIIAPCIPCI